VCERGYVDEIQLKAFDVRHERGNRRAHGLSHCRHREVSGDQEPFLREIRDKHAVAVIEIHDVVQLQRVRLILDHHLLDHALDLWFLAGLRQRIADQRPR
jgi:hypothetical protein